MMDGYSVYRHVNTINNKQYIGITKQKPEYRWGVNGIKYKSSPYFWNAICKYGWDNSEHEILESGLSKEEACDLEKYLIFFYQTQDNRYGYNVMEGGSAPSIPESVRKIMSQKMIGNKNGLGKVCSDEKKSKISAAQKGRTFTEEHKQNISKAKKGKTHAPISTEARRKISEAHEKKMVYCDETNTVYPSIQECARQLGLYPTSVCKCCKKKIKTTGGYHISYYNNDL